MKEEVTGWDCSSGNSDEAQEKAFFGSENSEALEYIKYKGFGITICCNKRLDKYLQELHQ